EFDKQNATLASVANGLRASDNETIKNMAVVLTRVGKTMGENRQPLTEIFIAAQPKDDPAAQERIRRTREAAQEAAVQAQAEAMQQNRTDAKSKVTVALDEALAPHKMKSLLDEAVQEKLY